MSFRSADRTAHVVKRGHVVSFYLLSFVMPVHLDRTVAADRRRAVMQDLNYRADSIQPKVLHQHLLEEVSNGNENGKNKLAPFKVLLIWRRKANITSRTANLSTPRQHAGVQRQ